jgi:hypothetical protein
VGVIDLTFVGRNVEITSTTLAVVELIPLICLLRPLRPLAPAGCGESTSIGVDTDISTSKVEMSCVNANTWTKLAYQNTLLRGMGLSSRGTRT